MKHGLFILILVTIFSGCDKSNLDAPAMRLEESLKVKTATYGSTVFNYTYDTQGRQLSCDNSDGVKRKYDYAIGSIKESIYINRTFEYFYKNDLNADGLCVKETKSNAPGYEQLYEYNPDMTLSRVITKNNGSITQRMDFFYSNENCDSIRFITNGAHTLTIVKEYYPDKPNVLNNEVFGNPHYGRSSRNMIKTETYINAGGSTGSCTNFLYDYDSMGRVSKETAQKGNTTAVGLFTYY